MKESTPRVVFQQQQKRIWKKEKIEVPSRNLEKAKL